MEDGARDALATFAAVKLRQRSPAFRLVVDIGQRVQRLIDAPELGDGLFESGRALERRHVEAYCRVIGQSRCLCTAGTIQLDGQGGKCRRGVGRQA